MNKKILAYAWINKKGQFQGCPIFSHYPRITFEKNKEKKFIADQKRDGFKQVEILIEIKK